MKRVLLAAVTAATLGLGMLPSASFAQTDFQLGIGFGDGGDWRYHHHHHCRWVQVWHHHQLVWVKQCGWGRYGDNYGERFYGRPDYGPPDYGSPDEDPYYQEDYGNPYN